MTIGIVDAAVGAMLGFVDAVGVDAKERIGEPAVAESGGVGEEQRDKEAADGEEDAEAEIAEAIVNFDGRDYAREGWVSLWHIEL